MVQRGGEPGGEEFGDADWLMGQLGDGDAEADATDAADSTDAAGASRPQGRRAAAPAPAEPVAEPAAEPEPAASTAPPASTAPGVSAAPPASPAEPVGTDASAPRTPWWTSRSRGRRAAEPEPGETASAPEAAAEAPLRGDAGPGPAEPSGRRRASSSSEESLDWFSLAAQTPQSPPAAEPADAPPMTTPAVPISDEPRSERGDTGVLDEPLRRRRDRGPALPPADPILTSVEPPVAPQRTPQPPAEPWAPAAPIVPAESQTPVVPGPATPTAPFALTWGDPAGPVVPGESAPGGAGEPSAQEPSPDEHPTGAFGEPLVPPPVSAAAASASAAATTDFDAALWSALQEGHTDEVATVAPSEPAAPTEPASGDAGSPLGGPAPFPAFASGEAVPSEPAAADAPVDDLLAGIALGGAAAAAVNAAQAAHPAEPESQPEAVLPAEPEAERRAEAEVRPMAHDEGTGRDDELELDEGLDDDGAADALDSTEESGFVWGIVPDPEAADPRAEDGPLGTVALAAVAAGAEDVAVDEPVVDAATEVDPSAQAGDAPLAEAEAEAEAPAPVADADAQDPLDPFGFGTEASTSPAARDEDAEPVAATALLPTAGRASAAAGAAAAGREPAGASRGGSGTDRGGSGGAGGDAARRRRLLLWIAGGLVAVLVLAGLFFLGTKLPFGGQPAASAPATSDSAAPSDTPAPAPTAAQPAGVHAWNTLFGGECIDPFTDAWAEDYTVVDCAAPHAAQLVLRGTLPGEAGAAFPGDAELAAQLGTACQADGVLDQNAISGITDLQLVFSYPLAEQWDAGERTFYCFANRSSGEPLTASIAGATPSQVAAG